MAVLLDYIKWRSDLSFNQDPFNELDAVVLTQLIYTDMKTFFSGYLDEAGSQDSFTLRELAEKTKKEADLKILNADYDQSKDDYNAFFYLASESKRYGDILVSSYTDILDNENDTQYAAAIFCLSDKEKFIAFRGTDESLTGWKEDFMISYTITRSQKLAMNYVKQALRKDKDSSFYISGHSKGGNLAIIAGISLKDDDLKRIKHIYDLDGPGLADFVYEELNMAEKNIYNRIDKITTRISPCYCVVGRIFEAGFSDSRIVNSTAKGIKKAVGQHSLISWKVNHLKFELADEYDKSSVWAGKIFDEWLSKQTLDDRKIFVDDIFNTLSDAGIKSLRDISANGLKGFKKIIEARAELSDLTKDMAAQLPKTGLSKIEKRRKNRIDILQKKLKSFSEFSIKARNYIRIDDRQ